MISLVLVSVTLVYVTVGSMFLWNIKPLACSFCASGSGPTGIDEAIREDGLEHERGELREVCIFGDERMFERHLVDADNVWIVGTLFEKS